MRQNKMLVKTSELSGVALDYAVAKCEGEEVLVSNITSGGTVLGLALLWVGHYDDFGLIKYEPSTDWTIAGPIIERERICPDYLLDGRWLAISRLDHSKQGLGPTLLIAAMRCLVASKMGDTIEIPDELLNK
jgi:hypothetical protein